MGKYFRDNFLSVDSKFSQSSTLSFMMVRTLGFPSSITLISFEPVKLMNIPTILVTTSLFECFNNKHIKEIKECIERHHPYDEPTYHIYNTLNTSKNIGSGMFGKRKIEFNSLLSEIKKLFNVSSIRHSDVLNKNINKIAVCGGSGSFLIEDSISVGADVFITSDLKYHDFFLADNKITIIDIGHYEGEQFTKDLIYEYLSKKFLNIALHLSNENTNPINYYNQDGT